MPTKSSQCNVQDDVIRCQKNQKTKTKHTDRHTQTDRHRQTRKRKAEEEQQRTLALMLHCLLHLGCGYLQCPAWPWALPTLAQPPSTPSQTNFAVCSVLLLFLVVCAFPLSKTGRHSGSEREEDTKGKKMADEESGIATALAALVDNDKLSSDVIAQQQHMYVRPHAFILSPFFAHKSRWQREDAWWRGRDVHRHTQTHSDTFTHTDKHTHTHRHANTDTQAHSHTQTHRQTHTITNPNTHTQTFRLEELRKTTLTIAEVTEEAERKHTSVQLQYARHAQTITTARENLMAIFVSLRNIKRHLQQTMPSAWQGVS